MRSANEGDRADRIAAGARGACSDRARVTRGRPVGTRSITELSNVRYSNVYAMYAARRPPRVSRIRTPRTRTRVAHAAESVTEGRRGRAAMGFFTVLSALASLQGLHLAVGSVARQKDPLATVLARIHPPEIPERDVRIYTSTEHFSGWALRM